MTTEIAPSLSCNDHIEFAERVRLNQSTLRAALKEHYDFIICGSGSSGSVVARRLAENSDVQVLLLEAGGSDDVAEVRDAIRWPTNYASERNWGFLGQPSPHLNGRRMPLAMGKVLGGGSSVNAMAWAWGHKNDWDYFASEAGDHAWNYQSVLKIFRRIEDWSGEVDSDYRGTGGPVFVQLAPDPNPIAPAMVQAAASAAGIPTFSGHNGRMMETGGGASLLEMRVRDGQRLSIFRSYTYPYLDRPNLTVLSHALVTRVIFEEMRAVGVEVVYEDRVHRIGAGSEVVLCLGAIHTPKVLMQSGIGDEAELRRWAIPVVEHLPGVGRNFQDHVMASCIWEYKQPLAPRNNAGEATFFWKSNAALDTPDLQICQTEVPFCSAESAARFNPPPAGWTLLPGVTQPKSRGRIRLTGPSPLDPLLIEDNLLSDPDDMKAAVAAVKLCREIGNSAPLGPYTKREVMPGNLKGVDLENFIREVATTYSHETCTAKMGRDPMSVVGGSLKVYGIERLRIADGSIMPRVIAGNTMAPCVVIGERAAEMLKAEHQL
ncbi:MAG TPA: GMC family oxidoreductase N-terminal domain-containing protein [Bryobacteraceae bacterium]|nr:GMC family oxidoreductase N-terminal domain-containing protein [Bryobacteraceae bacterium]